MIVVFVVDTSPSMSRPVSIDKASGASPSSGSGATEAAHEGLGLTRLDLAKMAVEDISRRLRRSAADHQRLVALGGAGPATGADPAFASSLAHLGQGGAGATAGDALLLLSTSRQYPDTASCAAGGRLLVGFGTEDIPVEEHQQQLLQQLQYSQQMDPLQHHHLESFQKHLKSLRAASWDKSSGETFPDDAGGAVGLNAALSMGLQLLSRYRLHSKYTENFGLGRLPCASMQLATEVGGRPTQSALQPACLILVTDGACLRHSPEHGGGSLQLQYGSQPLREFYKEPFRWDQRIFCLAVGDAQDSGQYLHPQLRALVDVTGGSHWMVRQPSALPTDAIVKRIRPLMPRDLPVNDPLFVRLPAISYSVQQSNAPPPTYKMPPGASFINGGPICCFQAYEGDESGRPMLRRAMLLYTASPATSTVSQLPQSGNELRTIFSQPLWCIPESFFPSKKLDSLPPRPAQPVLFYSKYPLNLGSKSFEPMQIIKMLHKLDQMILLNRKSMRKPAKCLHRDVYICEWLSPEGEKPIQVSISSHTEYFPVFCRGAGRPTLSDDADSFINVGILHAPLNSSTLAQQASPSRLATLTLLPPEPHILLPLLLRAAEAEHRAIKKIESKLPAGGTSNKINVILDDHWRSEFQAYLFRLPPYYQPAVKRCLRSVLPSTAQAILHNDANDSQVLQCFSKACWQKIRNGEQIARDTSERLERQEAGLRGLGIQRSPPLDASQSYQVAPAVRYGNYDPRMSIDAYLETLRSLPPPWRFRGYKNENSAKPQGMTIDAEQTSEPSRTALDVLGELSAQCLMAYYESRRRWIFGGPSLATRGLHVEGVSNGGSNSQRCGSKFNEREETLLSIAGVGVSMLNETSTARMGDYKERLVFSRAPIVGYGSNDATGVAATTAADGSPVWSVDDSAMPQTFFDSKTGDFVDNIQTRSLSKIMVNFGNPFREKRADSLVPLKYLAQAPSMQQRQSTDLLPGSPQTPPGSPPHSSFDSMEEGEAMFVRVSPSRSSPKREEPEESETELPPKRLRTESMDEHGEPASERSVAAPDPRVTVPPPPKKPLSTPRPPAPTTPGPPGAPQAPSKPSSAAPGVAVSHKSITKKAPVVPPKPPPPPPRSTQERPPPPAPTNDPSQSSRRLSFPPKLFDTATDPLPLAGSQSVPVVASKLIPNDSTRRPSVTASSSSTATTAVDLESPDKKPDVQLYPGWISVWSKSQNRWYFFDTKTNTSVWKWPPDT